MMFLWGGSCEWEGGRKGEISSVASTRNVSEGAFRMCHRVSPG